jgi:hypothetical protein
MRSLHDQGVKFIVIGGVAASTLGSPSVTFDLDICYERSQENLEVLARVLQSLHARPRSFPPDLPFKLDAAALLLGDHFIFSTDLGDLDCLGTPAGTQGYPDLVQHAVEVSFDDIVVKLAGLDDLIRMKRAAGRPKDLIELEILGALRDELDRDDS